MTVTIVEQFGLAMMPLFSATAAALISGTTRGTEASIRNALELSTTTAPPPTADGANSVEVPPPALKSAMSTPSNDSRVNSCTVRSFPRNGSVLPADRAEASGVIFAAGKFRFSSVFSISTPTAPVAPTIATCKSSLIKGRELYGRIALCQLRARGRSAGD